MLMLGAQEPTRVGRLTRWADRCFRFRKHCVVGLDIGSRAISLVQFRINEQKRLLKEFGGCRLPSGIVQDGAILDRPRALSQLQTLIEECEVRGQPVVLSVSGPSVIVKRLSLSGVHPQDLEDNLNWEGHRYIAHPIEDLCMDHQVVSLNTPGTVDVLLVAAKREVVEGRQTLALEAGLKPVGCDVNGLALANMASLAGSRIYGPHLIVNLNAEGCTIVVLDRGLPLSVHDVLWEDERRDESNGMEFSGRNKEAAFPHMDKGGEFPSPLERQNIIATLKGFLNVIGASGSLTRVQCIRVCGEGVTPKLTEILAGVLSTPVSVLHPLHGMGLGGVRGSSNESQRLGELAGVAVGLAARSDCKP